jgi:glucose-6-phosphate-specific signal transduction histidine kinase
VLGLLGLFQFLVNFAIVAATNRALGSWATPVQYVATIPSIILSCASGFVLIWALQKLSERQPKFTAPIYWLGALLFGLTMAGSRLLARNEFTPNYWDDPQSSIRIVLATAILYLIVHISLGVSSMKLAEQANAAESARASLEVQRGKLISAQEDVRRQIADFLHDRLQSDMVLLGMQMQKSIEKLNQQEKSVLQAYIDEIERIRQFDVRSVSKQLTPELTGPTLRPALEDLTSSYAKVMTVRIDLLEKGKLNKPLKLACYRIIEQGLLNAAKHANATNVGIIVQELDDELKISVLNDGQAVPDQPVAGAGFAIIDDWVNQYGGTWSLTSVGEQTQLKVSLNF